MKIFRCKSRSPHKKFIYFLDKCSSNTKNKRKKTHSMILLIIEYNLGIWLRKSIHASDYIRWLLCYVVIVIGTTLSVCTFCFWFASSFHVPDVWFLSDCDVICHFEAAISKHSCFSCLFSPSSTLHIDLVTDFIGDMRSDCAVIS